MKNRSNMAGMRRCTRHPGECHDWCIEVLVKLRRGCPAKALVPRAPNLCKQLRGPRGGAEANPSDLMPVSKLHFDRT